jgi:hypothetical protein
VALTVPGLPRILAAPFHRGAPACNLALRHGQVVERRAHIFASELPKARPHRRLVGRTRRANSQKALG